MSDPDYIDLFPNNNQKGTDMVDEEFNMDEEIFNPGRSKINDYKHTSKTIQRGNSMQGAASMNERNQQASYGEKPKRFINLSDEKIVWAGAIFVFFGVFVFLVGYWLGKSTLKDITFGNKQYQQKIEERLDQKKLENNLAVNGTTLTEPVKNGDESSVPAVENKQSGSAIASPLNVTNLPKENVLTVPSIHPVKPENKNVKLQNQNAKNTPTKNQAQSKQEDNYIIQVSAHTSMEKARSVEDNLRKSGFQSYLVEASVNGVTYYRVRVGKFSGKDEAQAALKKIKGFPIGKDSLILNLN